MNWIKSVHFFYLLNIFDLLSKSLGELQEMLFNLNMKYLSVANEEISKKIKLENKEQKDVEEWNLSNNNENEMKLYMMIGWKYVINKNGMLIGKMIKM